jgi:hypothetical protein
MLEVTLVVHLVDEMDYLLVNRLAGLMVNYWDCHLVVRTVVMMVYWLDTVKDFLWDLQKGYSLVVLMASLKVIYLAVTTVEVRVLMRVDWTAD